MVRCRLLAKLELEVEFAWVEGAINGKELGKAGARVKREEQARTNTMGGRRKEDPFAAGASVFPSPTFSSLCVRAHDHN